MNAYLRDSMIDPELFSLTKTYQFYAILKFAENTTKMNVGCFMVDT